MSPITDLDSDTGPTPVHPRRDELLLLGALTAYGAITIDLYLPALPAIGGAFGASPAVVQHSMAAFFIGMALGQLVYGPWSDRIGRRPLLVAGSVIYVLASLLCAMAPSIDWLIAGRFLQAIGACSGVVIARAVVRDKFDHQDSARIFSLLTLVLGIAPMLAPTAGAALVTAAGWRAVFVVLAGFGVLIGAAVFFALPETRSAKTASVAQNSSALHGYRVLLANRHFMGFVLAGAFNGAALFGYVSNAPDLIMVQLGFGAGAFGWLFALMAVGIIGSSQVNRVLLRSHRSEAILRVASLAGVATGALLLAVAVTGLGGTWGLLGVLFLALSSYGMIAANNLASALSVVPERAGAASALIGSAAFGTGALASALVGAFHDGTAKPMAAVMAGALLLSAVALFGLALHRGRSW
jgi:DHA1 family bicyclomycin/chloramphenicol resistance-like MFS transporter